MSRLWRLILSAFLGLVLPWVPGFWLPGMLLAAIPFPQGVHSDHALLYFTVAITIDCFLYAGVAYWLLTKIFSRSVKPRESKPPT